MAEPEKVGPTVTGEMVYVGKWRRLDWHCAECQPSLPGLELADRPLKMRALFEANRRKRGLKSAGYRQDD